jgi:hypothetical protein
MKLGALTARNMLAFQNKSKIIIHSKIIYSNFNSEFIQVTTEQVRNDEEEKSTDSFNQSEQHLIFIRSLLLISLIFLLQRVGE